MIDELKQWEYDKGYEKGKADTLKVIEDIKAEIKAIPYQRLFGSVSCYSMLDVILEIIDKHLEEKE